jgi:hypothetical protein
MRTHLSEAELIEIEQRINAFGRALEDASIVVEERRQYHANQMDKYAGKNDDRAATHERQCDEMEMVKQQLERRFDACCEDMWCLMSIVRGKAR